MGMNVNNNRKRIRDTLLSVANRIERPELLPTLIPEASPLVHKDPYAFTIGVSLDRGTKAEIIWTIPYYIQQDLGQLSPYLIYNMSLEELGRLFSRLPKRPRYINAAPKTLQQLTKLVVEKFKGDAEKIWVGKKAVEVQRTFESIYGVGPGISSMAVLLIESNFGIQFVDKSFMDIKPDVNTMRVLYRLGVIHVQKERPALTAARNMNPEFPGELDGPLWWVGRKWCFASDPDCLFCPMKKVCAKVGL